MNSFDTIPIHDLIRLYYEKHYAMRHGDLKKLISLKETYPTLFTSEQDDKIRDMINSIKEFQKSSLYKVLRKIELRKKIFVVNNDLIE